MAYDSEKKLLYTTVDENGDPIGISLDEISACIGDTSIGEFGFDLGALCESEEVNMWSKSKPVRCPSFGVLTAADRKSVHYGIDVSMAHGASFSDCLNAAVVNGGKYEYLRPRGGSAEPFRALDFDGYKHKAEPPYGYTVSHSKGNASGWVDVYLNPNADLTLADLNPTELESGDISSCKLAILLSKEDGSTPTSILPQKDTGGYYTLADIIGEYDDSAPVLRFTVPSEGTWNIAIAITEAVESNKENDDVFYMYLPYALFSIDYDPAYTGFKWWYPEDYSVAARNANGAAIFNTTTEVDNVYVNTAIEIEPDSETTKGTVTIEIGEYGDEFLTYGTYESDFLLSPGSVQVFGKTFTNIGSIFGEPYIDKIFIKAKCKFGGEYAEETSMKTVYFDFLTGTIKAEEQAPVSIKGINDSMEW